MDHEEIIQTKWNSDEAQLRIIFSIKEELVLRFLERDVEGVYWYLRSLRREIKAKLSTDESATVSKKLKRIDKIRLALLNKDESITKEVEDELMKLLYIKEEKFYMLLCDYMKRHGLYFREKEDPRKAITG